MSAKKLAKLASHLSQTDTPLPPCRPMARWLAFIVTCWGIYYKELRDMYDVNEAYRQWQSVPVDDLGYFSAASISILSHQQRMDLIHLALGNRWNTNGWRNRNNSLVDWMQFARWTGKTVMDFGCGFGMDGMQFGLHGANVILADMNPMNLYVAHQNAGAMGFHCEPLIVSTLPPWFAHLPPIDLFWSMGVLHHFPHAADILRRVIDVLTPAGECRILLYSDKRWREMMKEEPPASTHEHPRFREYVRKCDSVGEYADWYDEDKVRALVDGFGVVESTTYLCDGQMIGAVIKKSPVHAA